MKFSLAANKKIYVNTVLQYCSENQSIRLQGPPRFFVKLIFEQLEEQQKLMNRDDLTQVDIDNHDRFEKLCFGSLSNLSLV